jgi:hypothetical protein
MQTFAEFTEELEMHAYFEEEATDIPSHETKKQINTLLKVESNNYYSAIVAYLKNYMPDALIKLCCDYYVRYIYFSELRKTLISITDDSTSHYYLSYDIKLDDTFDIEYNVFYTNLSGYSDEEIVFKPYQFFSCYNSIDTVNINLDDTCKFLCHEKEKDEKDKKKKRKRKNNDKFKFIIATYTLYYKTKAEKRRFVEWLTILYRKLDEHYS